MGLRAPKSNGVTEFLDHLEKNEDMTTRYPENYMPRTGTLEPQGFDIQCKPS